MVIQPRYYKCVKLCLISEVSISPRRRWVICYIILYGILIFTG